MYRIFKPLKKKKNPEFRTLKIVETSYYGKERGKHRNL